MNKWYMGLVTVLFILLATVVFAAPPSPGDEGTQIGQGGTGESSPQGARRQGPPPEAYTACEGKTAGSTAQFTAPNGETVSGTCTLDGGKLVLRPNRFQGNARDGRRGPPPAAYTACEGKTVGSAAQFTNPRGEMVSGICEEEGGKLVLRPNARRGDGRQGQSRDGAGRSTVGQ
jgi:hypothetical protein